MKKNAMLKIAAILLVAVLLTTCAISSTFAKYVTEGTLATSETARVAAWGVEVSTTFTADDALFAKEYGAGATPATATTNHVESTAFVVAPGTSNSMAIAAVATGTPEVSGTITITPTVTLGAGWVDDEGEFYCPVTFNGETLTATGANELTPIVTYFDAGQNLANLVISDATFDWEWAAGGDNEKDTYLGDNNTTATIQVSFEVTIEQNVSAGGPTA